MEPDIGMRSFADLAKRILGKALVMKVEGGSEAHQALNIRSSVRLWKLNVGEFYLIHPGSLLDKKCPYEEYSLRELEVPITHTADKAEGRNYNEPFFDRLLAHIYRQHPVLEEGAIYFEDVQMLLEDAINERQQEADRAYMQACNDAREKELQAKLAKGREDFKRLQEEANDARRRVTETEGKINVLREEARQAHKEAENNKQELEDFLNGFADDEETYRKRDKEQTRIIESQRWQIKNLKENSFQKIFNLLRGLSISRNTLKENIMALEQFWGEAIIISEKAYKDLEDYSNPLTYDMFLEFLEAFQLRLWPAYKTGAIGCRLEDCLEGLRVSYSPNESAGTMSHPKCRDERTVSYLNVAHVCEEHLRLAKDDCRVYFKYLEDHGKILIGRLGMHLNTIGTKKRGL